MILLECFWKLAAILNLKWNMCLYSSSQDRYVSGSIHRTGKWEGHMVSNMIQTMRKHPHSTLLDIGGNIGYYTLAAAAANFKVNVFEPVPTNAAMIQQSMSANNFTSITLHTVALGAQNQEFGMGVDSYNQGGVKHSPGTQSFTMLPTFKLDNILNPETHPLFIKIDIEGGECSAVEGMKHYISHSTKIIGVILEFNQCRAMCCNEWVQTGGFFDILHKKHNLCPMYHSYDFICNADKTRDLIWSVCRKSLA